jgi:hypothetical protein
MTGKRTSKKANGGSRGASASASSGNGGTAAGAARPSAAQRRYLERGVDQAGGKLPIFDDEGQEIDARTIRACIKAGWAEPWFANPLKPDWLVCKLTDAGRAVLTAD